MDRMVDAVIKSALSDGKATAFQFMGKKTSYDDFLKQIKTVAGSLTYLGVSKGDVVCIIMPNMPQAIVMIYAANLIGAQVNMIHPLSSASEVKGYIKQMECKTVLVLDQLAGLFKDLPIENIIVTSAADALGFVKKIFVKHVEPDFACLSWNDFIKMGRDTESADCADTTHETALILYSGGTTGNVKGVCLSNYSVNTSARQMLKVNPMINKDDKVLSVMPIFHGNGLVIGVHTMLMVGGCCVLIPRFTPESYVSDLLKYRCNYMSGVPALFERMIEVKKMQKADLSFLKGIFCGADALSSNLERRLNSFFKAHNCPVPVRQAYGMTEGVVATTLNPYDHQKEGSIGLPLDGVEVKIVEPCTEKELSVGEVGEIVFSSDTNMIGYYKNPEETALVKKKHSDGKYWIHSGDLGCKDDDGFVFFKGRIKRMIVTNGYNVYPNELENVIDFFDMVKKSCVVSAPFSEGTNIVKAFIVLKKGYEPSDELRNSIRGLCREKIARYAVPKKIEFIDRIPTTKVGKIDYKALESLVDQPV